LLILFGDNERCYEGENNYGKLKVIFLGDEYFYEQTVESENHVIWEQLMYYGLSTIY